MDFWFYGLVCGCPESRVHFRSTYCFRIIASKVTGPILQLAGPYQGLQGVQLSMERLSDIVDQAPESKDTDRLQIYPTYQGSIRYENIAFSFLYKTNQIDNVIKYRSWSICRDSGQSGSVKCTTKVTKAYINHQPTHFIDDYDISKVALSSLRRQIGIVPQDSLFEGTISENIAPMIHKLPMKMVQPLLLAL